MIKKELLLSGLLLGVLQLHAQETVATSGGNATGSNGNVSYTLGQTFFVTQSGTTGTVAQGVHQPFEIQTVLGMDNFNINLLLSVFPNPTTNSLQLDIKELDLNNLKYQMYDLTGKLIYNEKIVAESTTIKMEQLQAAIYVLKVVDNNKELKTFKIVKN
jgi:Secretion system C-terminal sorting domain